MSNPGIEMEDRQVFLSYDYSKVDPDSVMVVNDSIEKKVTFNGLSKEEIMKYSDDPKWVKIRWVIFILFWIIWFAMLAGAILIVVFEPSCPYRPKLNWWDKEIVYQIEIANFKDTDGDRIGDLKGIEQEIDYFDRIGVRSLLFDSSFLDPESPDKVNKLYGDEDSLKKLRKTLDQNDMHLIIDLPYDYIKNDTHVLTHWLTHYIDGVRIVKFDEQLMENATYLSHTVEKISKKTFKPKFIALYPFESTNLKLSTIIKGEFLNMKFDTGFDQSTFMAKIKKLYNDKMDSISFIISNFDSDRFMDSFKDETTRAVSKMIHSIFFLLKGTPFTLYGDEIEFNKEDKLMQWDKTINCGFSTDNKTKSESSCEKNVKKSMAAGAGKTLTRIYRELSALRQEPSFRWGELIIDDNPNDHIISFVREAKRFEGYIVAANADSRPIAVDFKKKYDTPVNGTVSYFYSIKSEYNNEFQVNQVVPLNNILLKYGEFLVLKYNKDAKA